MQDRLVPGDDLNDEAFYRQERRRMVQEHLRQRKIHDRRVLEAMLTVPRHLFLPVEHRHLAYADSPLPIGEGQTISQPFIVALMTQLLELKGEEVVLEVGTGSGYQAAILAYLAAEVHTIERHARLARRAARRLKDLGYRNVFFHSGDGTRGLPEYAPYGGIVVTAAAPHVPPPLLEQLAGEGYLVIPVGGRGNQMLERWYRKGSEFERERVAPVAFVPLVGDFGWAE